MDQWGKMWLSRETHYLLQDVPSMGRAWEKWADEGAAGIGLAGAAASLPGVGIPAPRDSRDIRNRWNGTAGRRGHEDLGIITVRGWRKSQDFMRSEGTAEGRENKGITVACHWQCGISQSSWALGPTYPNLTLYFFIYFFCSCEICLHSLSSHHL